MSAKELIVFDTFLEAYAINYSYESDDACYDVDNESSHSKTKASRETAFLLQTIEREETSKMLVSVYVHSESSSIQHNCEYVWRERGYLNVLDLF